MVTLHEKVGAGVGVQGIVDINAFKASQYEYASGATRGYSRILVGNTLPFEVSTSSNGVYMTIISEAGPIICKNHEICKSRNYILDRRDGLLVAKGKKSWIDKDGCSHMVSAKDIYVVPSHPMFDPSMRFTDSSGRIKIFR